jgi:ketosteroid isomerase-like protein
MADNADVISGAYDSFSKGDIPAVIETLDPEVQWDVTAILPQGGSFSGPDGVGGFFEGLAKAWEEFRVSLDDLIASGDDVVAVGRAEGKLSGGDSAGYGFAHVFTLRGGKIVRFREYADPDEALR